MNSALLLLLALNTPAEAAKPQVLSIVVEDAETGDPVATAEVRIPNTEGRRKVDPETGVWEASMLYTYDGDTLIFEKGLAVAFTVSAPGYHALSFNYVLRHRKNTLLVPLSPMAEQEVVQDAEEAVPIQWFKRTTVAQDDGAT